MWGANYKSYSSWFWKGFVEALSIVNFNVSRVVGNGEKFSVSNCPWIPGDDSFRRPLSDVSNPYTCIKDLSTPLKEWDAPKLSGVFNNYRDIEDILRIYIPRCEAAYKRIWPYSKCLLEVLLENSLGSASPSLWLAMS